MEISSNISIKMGVPNFLVLAVLTFVTFVICNAKPPVPEDIGTNFFLKASKSVPRIGRRTMEYENYFLKASKSIPRIGRRTLGSPNQEEWVPKDSQENVKRTFLEKYFKENEQPVLTDIEKLYHEYPAAFPPEEIYPERGVHPKPDTYWPRTKKDEEVEDQPQNQSK